MPAGVVACVAIFKIALHPSLSGQTLRATTREDRLSGSVAGHSEREDKNGRFPPDILIMLKH